MRRTLDSSDQLSNLESSWGSLPGRTTLGSATISPTVNYNYGTADRLTSIFSGGMTGSIARTATTDAFSLSAYPSTASSYNRILKNSSGQPSNYLAQMNGFTIRNTGFNWNSDRLLTALVGVGRHRRIHPYHPLEQQCLCLWLRRPPPVMKVLAAEGVMNRIAFEEMMAGPGLETQEAALTGYLKEGRQR